MRQFEELEHTADIAFLVRGKNLDELLQHAYLALTSKFPPFWKYALFHEANDLPSIIRSLNQAISIADEEIGAPFKAVSYHGTIAKNSKGILEWEMIVDV